MIIDILRNVPDYRRKQGRRYQELSDVLIVFLLAVLSGATSYRKIHSFIDENFDKIKELLGFNWKQAPAYTTLRDILLSLSESDLEAVVRQSQVDVKNRRKTVCGKFVHLCFDGKVLKKSFDNFKGNKAAQILTAFLPAESQVIAQVDIADKDSEIPKVRSLLSQLKVEGAIITTDALHCQVETLKTVKDNGAETILQVKENQPNLASDCRRMLETQEADDIYEEKAEKGHGRIVSRMVKVYSDLKLTDTCKWLSLLVCAIAVIVVRSDYNTKTGKWDEKPETRYYVSTTKLDAESFCNVIRDHWSIENRLHYVRDVAMAEDASRIREKPGLFARIKSIANNILRHSGVKNITDALYRNALNFDRLLNYPILGLKNSIINAK